MGVRVICRMEIAGFNFLNRLDGVADMAENVMAF
jgi:hypothetical protein